MWALVSSVTPLLDQICLLGYVPKTLLNVVPSFPSPPGPALAWAGIRWEEKGAGMNEVWRFSTTFHFSDGFGIQMVLDGPTLEQGVYFSYLPALSSLPVWYKDLVLEWCYLLNFPNRTRTQNFGVHCYTMLKSAEQFERGVLWCQMVINGLGCCVKTLTVSFHHSEHWELFLTNAIDKERKTVQKSTCKFLKRASLSFSFKVCLGKLLAWE